MVLGSKQNGVIRRSSNAQNIELLLKNDRKFIQYMHGPLVAWSTNMTIRILTNNSYTTLEAWFGALLPATGPERQQSGKLFTVHVQVFHQSLQQIKLTSIQGY